MGPHTCASARANENESLRVCGAGKEELNISVTREDALVTLMATFALYTKIELYVRRVEIFQLHLNTKLLKILSHSFPGDPSACMYVKIMGFKEKLLGSVIDLVQPFILTRKMYLVPGTRYKKFNMISPLYFQRPFSVTVGNTPVPYPLQAFRARCVSRPLLKRLFQWYYKVHNTCVASKTSTSGEKKRNLPGMHL